MAELNYRYSENEYLISNEGILFNKDKTELIQYPIGNSRTNYTIPEETETIRIGALTNCYKLENIEVYENNQHFISVERILFDIQLSNKIDNIIN